MYSRRSSEIKQCFHICIAFGARCHRAMSTMSTIALQSRYFEYEYLNLFNNMYWANRLTNLCCIHIHQLFEMTFCRQHSYSQWTLDLRGAERIQKMKRCYLQPFRPISRCLCPPRETVVVNINLTGVSLLVPHWLMMMINNLHVLRSVLGKWF